MSLLGFILADLTIGSILQEQENTRKEIEKLRKQLEDYYERNKDGK